jgi:hypothetical protein
MLCPEQWEMEGREMNNDMEKQKRWNRNIGERKKDKDMSSC